MPEAPFDFAQGRPDLTVAGSYKIVGDLVLRSARSPYLLPDIYTTDVYLAK